MFRLRLAVLIAGIVLALASSSLAFADAQLEVAPASSTVSVGDIFAIDVNISDITDLAAFEFDLSFDPSIVQATGTITEGSFFQSGGGFLPGTIDNSLGTIVFNANTLLGPGPGLEGSGTLVVFDFTAIAPGTSALNLDPTTFILLDSSGAFINATTANGSVTVQGTSGVVPEPSVLMMLGVGMLGLTGLTLKKTVL
jgi:Cohesin domain/PEP-CTERM motif